MLALIFPPDQLLFTQRGKTLARHAGQVSFPGGKPEPEDANLLVTALRETREEVGLDAEGMQVIGQLDGVFTAQHVIAPHVALWTGASDSWPSARTAEVDSCFLAPLHLLAEPELHSVGSWKGPDGLSWRTDEYALPSLETPLGQQAPQRIWGATGRMTRQLLDLSAQPD